MREDILTLHRHLTSRTRHVFNLLIADEYGAFYNLVQHHGYPTPLLDWTYSPYVACFFAYHRIKNSLAAAASDGAKVRIFAFDQQHWRNDYPQMNKLTIQPHFSILEFIAIENERMIPQQAVSTLTNIDDIETYIGACEVQKGKKYLHIIDLPVKERPLVMRELAVMGITAGALFPGFDGACEELRERFFQE